MLHLCGKSASVFVLFTVPLFILKCSGHVQHENYSFLQVLANILFYISFSNTGNIVSRHPILLFLKLRCCMTPRPSVVESNREEAVKF